MIKSTLILLLSSIIAQAIAIRNPGLITGDPDTYTQDRFEANSPGPVINPDFFYDQFDFSGVGWGSANAYNKQSLALIDNMHFVTAQHIAFPSAVSFLTTTGVQSFATNGFIDIEPGDLVTR